MFVSAMLNVLYIFLTPDSYKYSTRHVNYNVMSQNMRILNDICMMLVLQLFLSPEMK